MVFSADIRRGITFYLKNNFVSDKFSAGYICNNNVGVLINKKILDCNSEHGVISFLEVSLYFHAFNEISSR